MIGVGLPLLFGVMLVLGVALLAFVLVRILVGGLGPTVAEGRSPRSAEASEEES